MIETVHSEVTGKDYRVKDCVRLVNPVQAATYMRLGILPLDIYPSIGFSSNKPVMVFIFNKKETKYAYARWLESESMWQEVIVDECCSNNANN